MFWLISYVIVGNKRTGSLLYRGFPNDDDRRIFENTIYGQTWPKETVLVLNIEFEFDIEDIWLVVHNRSGYIHAEEVLKRYMNVLTLSTKFRNYLEKCEFVIYMNWAPCDKCADVLRDVFDFCAKGSVFFTAFYTSKDKYDSYANYKGWKMLEKHVTFEFMTKYDYTLLGITSIRDNKTKDILYLGTDAIEKSNKKHTRYALNKMPSSKMDSVKSFLKTCR